MHNFKLTKRSSPFEPFFSAERGTSLCQFDRVMIARAESVQFYLAAPLLRQTVAVIGWNGGVKRTLITGVFIRSALLCQKSALTS